MTAKRRKKRSPQTVQSKWKARFVDSFKIGAMMLIVLHIFLWVTDSDEVNLNLTSHPSFLQVSTFILSIFTMAGTVYLLACLVYKKSLPKYLLPVLFVLQGLFYMLSFTAEIAPNGDNAEYLITAKSLVENGSAIRLDHPKEIRNPLSSIGFPALLAPVYKIFGFDLLKMKLLVSALALMTGFIFYQVFLFYRPKQLAATLALVAFASPYLIGTSSSLMTETPYLFWSSLALWFAHNYAKANRHWIWWLIALFAATAMSYLTRAIGVSVGISVFIFLLLKCWPLSDSEEDQRAGTATWKKLLAFGTPLLLGGVWWQVRQSTTGPTHFDMLFNGYLFEQFSQNTFALLNVLGQMLFNGDAFRWYRLSPEHMLPAINILWIAIQGILLLGLLVGLRKKQLLAIYVLAAGSLILFGSATPQERVMMRYISILLPFLVYYFFVGTELLIKIIWDKVFTAKFPNLQRSLPYLLLLQIYLVSASGNRYNTLTKSPVYNSYYNSFLSAANWCGDHLPPESIVMSVKPRLVYVLSGLKGVTMAKEQDRYSEAWATGMLEKIRSNQVTHLIVDAISLTTKENIYPFLENHPEYFEALPVPGLSNQCTVVRVK